MDEKKGHRKITFLKKWCRRPDSNWRPTDYKSVALPTVLLRRNDFENYTILSKIHGAFYCDCINPQIWWL